VALQIIPNNPLVSNAKVKFAMAGAFCCFAAAFLLCLHLLFHQSLHFHFVLWHGAFTTLP
jgi:hypothetical protein